MNQKKTTKSAVKSSSKSTKRSTRPTKAVAKKPVAAQRKRQVNNKSSKLTAKRKSVRKARPLFLYQKDLFKPLFKVLQKTVSSLISKAKATKLLDVPFRAVFMLVVLAIVFLLTHSVQTNASGSNDTVSVNIFQQKSQQHESPNAVTVAGPAQSDAQFSTYPTWSQDFGHYNSKTLDQRDWEINTGWPQNGNNEAEYYTNSPTNLRISNGSLVMEATQQSEPGGLQYASSRIDTDSKVSFLYGRIDVTAELPDGVGTWPAIWFLPANNKYEDLSPPTDTTRFLNGGEMDMVEAVGFNPNVVYGVVHTLQTNQTNPNAVGDFNQVTVANNNVQFNTYSMLWTPSSITFEINNTPFFTYTKPAGADYTTWPFDQPFYMIMNLALGGVWGGEDTTQFPGNGIDNSALPASMQIKSIYYYSYTGQQATN